MILLLYRPSTRQLVRKGGLVRAPRAPAVSAPARAIGLKLSEQDGVFFFPGLGIGTKIQSRSESGITPWRSIAVNNLDGGSLKTSFAWIKIND